ncbi:hypothetical protein RSAG8_07287, partial [Rhizoctonia solani AG-8 WAC10335]
MVGMHARDGAYSPMPQSAQAPSQSVPLWIPIVICVVLVVVPVSIYLAYLFYTRRPHRIEDKEASVPPSPDVKWTDPFDTRRPSTNKWTLSVPKWNTPSGGVRRSSDGGFPPGTRHIVFPDPTLAASVESLNTKAPSLGPSIPIHIRYPTPPPAVHVAA